jgi:hypothetical protein
MQGGRKNSDADAFVAANSDEKFSAPESGENFIRQNLVQIGPNRYVLLESALFLVYGFRRPIVNAARWPAMSAGSKAGPANAPIALEAPGGLPW